MMFYKHDIGMIAILSAFWICCLAAALVAQDSPVAKDLLGTWNGKLPVAGAELRIVIKVSENESGQLSATMDSPDQGAYGIPLSKVALSGTRVRMEVSSIGGIYEGDLDRSAAEVRGTWQQGGASLPLTMNREKSNPAVNESRPKVEKPAPVHPDAARITGLWMGKLKVSGSELRIVFHLDQGDDGSLNASLDSPDQGAKGIPVSKVTFEGKQLRLEVASIGGSYEGTVNEDFSRIEGTWRQGGGSFPLTLAPTDKVAEPNRPQHPEKPYPYAEEEVTFENTSANITLAGTLTLPRSGGPFPAVLLISGSGPQDRDETVFGHRPFWVLADYLTRRGIAVLRYDDRGVGQSTGDFGAATSEDFAGDALAGVGYLKSRPDIRPGHIGLIGHSEGGMIAPLAAVESREVAFIVLLAGPGIPGDRLLDLQSALIMKANGASEALIRKDQEMSQHIFGIIKREADDAAAQEAISAYFQDEWEQMDEAMKTAFRESGSSPDQLKLRLKTLVSPWFRYFLNYDPAPTLQKVACPVLALNGEKDLQVPPKENLDAIAAALKTGGNKDFTVQELSGLNHLFQTAETGAPSEYAHIEETFAPSAMALISDWIRKEAAL